MCPPNPDASLSWVVGGSFSGLQKLRTSLTSACSWCVDVIFHQCMEDASTLVVLLEENKTTPCSLSQLWFKTHLQSSGCGRIHSTGGVFTCLCIRPVCGVCPSYHCCPSQSPGQSSVCGLWRRFFLQGASPPIVCSGVWDLDEPTCRCPCLGLGVTVFLQRPRESGPQKGL